MIKELFTAILNINRHDCHSCGGKNTTSYFCNEYFGSMGVHRKLYECEVCGKLSNVKGETTTSETMTQRMKRKEYEALQKQLELRNRRK